MGGKDVEAPKKPSATPRPGAGPPGPTYVSADVDEQRGLWVRVVRQVRAADPDQRVQVVLLELPVKGVARHLGGERRSQSPPASWG